MNRSQAHIWVTYTQYHKNNKGTWGRLDKSVGATDEEDDARLAGMVDDGPCRYLRVLGKVEDTLCRYLRVGGNGVLVAGCRVRLGWRTAMAEFRVRALSAAKRWKLPVGLER